MRRTPSSRHLLQAIFDFSISSEGAEAFREISDLVSAEHDVSDESIPVSVSEHQASHSAMFAAHVETLYALHAGALWKAILAVRELSPPPPSADCGVIELKGSRGRSVRLHARRWGAWRSPNCVLVLQAVEDAEGAGIFGLLDFGDEVEASPGSLHFTHFELISQRMEFAGAPFWFLGGKYVIADTEAEAWLQFTDGAPRSLYDVARHIAVAAC